MIKEQKGPQKKINQVEEKKNVEEEQKNPVEDNRQIGEKQEKKQGAVIKDIAYKEPLFNPDPESD